MEKLTTHEIECAVSNYFDWRKHLVVPNVSWGFGVHECDLLIASKSGYLTEVEIKVSAGDLREDAKKRHKHQHYKIKYLYFAIPTYLVKYLHLIPERAGVLVVLSKDQITDRHDRSRYKKVYKIADAQANAQARAIGDSDRYKLARLGALRIWNLKHELECKRVQIQELKGEICKRKELIQTK